MKLLLNIIRVLVALLFIFSGLVKANDPLGLSYKMKEFFEIWNEGLKHVTFPLRDTFINFFLVLHEHSLPLAVVMIAVEIIAGVALLLGWRMKILRWLLLLLIIFFTFLTAYAYYSGRFTNCGCFGDCLPISPGTSFLKDLVLTGLIILLFVFKNDIRPYFSTRTNFAIMGLTVLFSFGVQSYVLSYLPVIDCLPFKKGNNITEQMKPPPGSVQDSFAIRFVYEKAGRTFEFSPEELPADLSTYSFKDRVDKLVRKGNSDPPIKGLSFKTMSGQDSTDAILSEPYCFLLFSENLRRSAHGWQRDFYELKNSASSRNLPVYIVTASANDAAQALGKTSFGDVPVMDCDFTVIRSAARTNPCLYLLGKGTVINKWSYKRIGDAVASLRR